MWVLLLMIVSEGTHEVGVRNFEKVARYMFLLKLRVIEHLFNCFHLLQLFLIFFFVFFWFRVWIFILWTILPALCYPSSFPLLFFSPLLYLNLNLFLDHLQNLLCARFLHIDPVKLLQPLLICLHYEVRHPRSKEESIKSRIFRKNV